VARWHKQAAAGGTEPVSLRPGIPVAARPKAAPVLELAEVA
jgi:hypothetical protein